MKHISILRGTILTLIFFIGTALSFAQGPTMDWAADSNLVNADGEDVAVTSIVNKQGNSLVWNQITDNVTESNQFIITNVTGTWDVQSNLGEIDYSLTLEDTNASLKVLGDDDGVILRLIVHENDSTISTYILRIDSLIHI